MLFDLKTLNSALDQLEEERGIPRAKTLLAIEDSLAAAYKKDYGKRGQIIRARFDIKTGEVEFEQIKIVVDESMLKEEDDTSIDEPEDTLDETRKVKFNEEHHMMLDDARRIKKDSKIGDEIVFPLEIKEDFGRIAAQTAKQVIIQKIREAEKVSVLEEYGKRTGEIVSGHVQRIERGNVFIDLGRATGLLYRMEQIPGEHYRQGERIRALLVAVEETPRGINLRLSRAHPQFVSKLFEIESPEVANEVVEIRAIAREAGARTKIAVYSNDDNIDAQGSVIGQHGIRVSTVISELSGEKIDIIEWSDLPENFIANALSPGKVLSIELDEDNREAVVTVSDDQLSLVIGKGGQNVRLAAKLTGWKLDIITPSGTGRRPSPAEVASKVEDVESNEEKTKLETGEEPVLEDKN